MREEPTQDNEFFGEVIIFCNDYRQVLKTNDSQQRSKEASSRT